MRYLTFALGKGRLAKQTLALFEQIGITCEEIKDKDYHFLTKEEFVKKINESFFLEYVEYNGNYYGTSYEGMDADKVVILEPSGLKHYIKHARENIKICYITCDKKIREKRKRACPS